jgi:putative transposase
MRRRVLDDEGHSHFLTFSCYKRRRLLNLDKPKAIVLGVMAAQLSLHDGVCAGFVVMPDHVHSIIGFPEANRISEFVKHWKRISSFQIRRFIEGKLAAYSDYVAANDPIWQPKYHDFNIYSEAKFLEKLEYMHLNPVRAGLADRAVDWRWSSARHYELGRSVGIPIHALV